MFNVFNFCLNEYNLCLFVCLVLVVVREYVFCIVFIDELDVIGGIRIVYDY